MWRAGAYLALIGLAGPAGAFQPPPGCEGLLTVQYRACEVEHVWRCPGDAPGDSWMAVFDQNGPLQVRRVDREFQWLETYLSNPTRTETMDRTPSDPASLTELLETGEDLYDFRVIADGTATRYQGFDRLTGESVVIDGQTLLRTEYSYQALDDAGQELWSRAGRQYVSAQDRLFFFGQSWSPDAPDQIEDNAPIRMIRPGQPGFMATKPTHGCDVVVSGLLAQSANLRAGA